MKLFINIIVSDKILRLSTIFSCTLLFVHAIYILIIYRSLPPFIPLYNQLPWGDLRLGTKPEIVFPFLTASVILILNIFVIVKVYEKIPLIARILSITTFLVSVLSLIFIFRTTQLVV